MYLTKMNDEEMKGFVSKFNSKEVGELESMFECYTLFYYDKKASEYLDLFTKQKYNLEEDSEELSLTEAKNMFRKMDFGELSTITWLLEDIRKYNERNNILYLIAKSLLDEKRKIVMVKNIENLEIDELDYYLKNISSNSREWYAIDAKSADFEIDAVGFYNYYHDQDIKRLEKKIK